MSGLSFKGHVLTRRRGDATIFGLAIVVLIVLSAVGNVSAQQPASVTSDRPNQISQTELSPAARASLDAAVEALQRGALADAERSARAAILAAPRSPVPHNILGVVLDRSGRAEAAVAEFNSAIGLD